LFPLCSSCWSRTEDRRSVTITPLSPERLGITGDVELELRVPFDGDEYRFHLAISDGTLIAGEYGPEDDRFHYQVEIESAGITRIAGDTVTVDWPPEWVTIGVYQPVPARAIEPLPLRPVPAHLDVGLVHPPVPPQRRGALYPAQALLDFRRVALHPAVDGGVIDGNAALGQHLL
jgi:hypothetical protein